MNHPHIKTLFKVESRGRYDTGFNQPDDEPVEATQMGVMNRKSAEDGSRRLAVAICQYHVKYADTQERSFWWSRRGKEISFGKAVG